MASRTPGFVSRIRSEGSAALSWPWRSSFRPNAHDSGRSTLPYLHGSGAGRAGAGFRRPKRRRSDPRSLDPPEEPWSRFKPLKSDPSLSDPI